MHCFCNVKYNQHALALLRKYPRGPPDVHKVMVILISHNLYGIAVVYRKYPYMDMESHPVQALGQIAICKICMVFITKSHCLYITFNWETI